MFWRGRESLDKIVCSAGAQERNEEHADGAAAACYGEGRDADFVRRLLFVQNIHKDIDEHTAVSSQREPQNTYKEGGPACWALSP